MALTLDGHASSVGAAANTATVALTTSLTNDIIVVMAFSQKNATPHRTVSGITDTAGLTWTKRSAIAQDSAVGQFITCFIDAEVWWAYSSGALTGDTITVTYSGATDAGVLIAFGVNSSGTAFSASSPWDTNGSLPATNFTAGVVTPSATVSTTAANTLLFAVSAGNQIYGGTAASGYTEIDFNTDFGGSGAGESAQYQVFASAQSGITVNGGEAATSPLFIVDALAQPSAGGATPTAGWQRNEGDFTNALRSVRGATASQPPAFGRAIAAPVSTIAGMAWFEPPDRDRRVTKVNVEAPPAVALTPATLPVPIRGMAWFEPPDVMQAVRRLLGIEPSQLVFKPRVVTWAFNASDAIRLRAAPVDNPPASGRVAATSVAISGMAWFEPPDERLTARPIRIGDPSALVVIPQTITWAFGSSDTIFLPDAPLDAPPAFGRAPLVQTVGISGMAWFEPPDRDYRAIKINVEAAPAIALTPATLPPHIAGMAWFEAPDRDKASIRVTFDYPPAFGRSLTAPVNTVSGMAWFEPPDAIRFSRLILDAAPSILPTPIVTVSWSFVAQDVFAARRVPMDVPPALGRSVPAVGISGMAWFAPLDRDPSPYKARVETSPAITFTPAALPSIGMAWFEQQDRALASIKWRPDAPPAFGRSFNVSVGISGMAWFAPPDRDPPPFKSCIEAPASLALTPGTLPVRVSGMAWFISVERDRQMPKVFGDSAMAQGFLGLSFNPSFTILQHLSIHGVDIDIATLPAGTPAPFIASTDGTIEPAPTNVRRLTENGSLIQ